MIFRVGEKAIAVLKATIHGERIEARAVPGAAAAEGLVVGEGDVDVVICAPKVTEHKLH